MEERAGKALTFKLAWRSEKYSISLVTNPSACLFSSGYCGLAFCRVFSKQVNGHLPVMLGLQTGQRSDSPDQLLFFFFCSNTKELNIDFN